MCPIPSSLFLVARRDGKMIGPYTLEGMAILEKAYQHVQVPEFRPYRVVEFREVAKRK